MDRKLHRLPNVKRNDCEILVIGAGVSGLAATATLARAGREVRCLEAGDRIGGRILTMRDPLAPLPIELGAEFVHGRPPATWDWIRSAGLTTYEHTAKALHLDRGRVLTEKEVGEFGDHVLEKMAKSSRRKDESFADYLAHSSISPAVKNWARIHIEGFNAARQDLVSADSLEADAEAAGKIEGDRSFRILNGYDALPAALLRSIPDYASVVQLQSVVERIDWRRGLVEVHYRSAIENQPRTLRCRQVIITVPLGVLQAKDGSPGAILFDPEPKAALDAAHKLQFGQVYRVTFRFPKRSGRKTTN